jgi:NADH-quinone oxidoreductase subunit H
MTTCLKYLVPISCFLFLGAVVWPLLLASVMQRSTWTPEALGVRAAAEIRESAPAASIPAATAAGAGAGAAVQARRESATEGTVR